MPFLEPIAPRTTGRSDAVTPAARRAAMLAHPTLAVAVVDGGRIRQTNAAWRALFVLPRDVTVESHVATLFPSAGLADRFERTLQAAFAEASRGGLVEGAIVAAPIEQTLVRRDGKPVVGELVVTLLRPDDVANPLGGDAIWQIRDITVERTLRRELRDLEDYHRELSRHQWDMTFVIDRKARIAYASASVEAMLGYPVNALLGEPFVLLLDPSHAADAEHWLRSVAGRRPGEQFDADMSFHLRAVAASGEARVLACRTRDCFETPRVAGMVIHARDVTHAGAQTANETHDRSGVADASSVATSLQDTSSEAPAALPASDDRSAAALVALAHAAAVGGVEAAQGIVDEAARHLGASAFVLRGVDGFDAVVGVGADVDPVDIAIIGSDAWPALGVGDDGAPQLQVVADVTLSGFDAETERRLAAAGIAAFVDVPAMVAGGAVGSVTVASAAPRAWSDADVSFAVGIGLLAAHALAPSPVQATDPLAGLPGRAEVERRIAERVADVDHAPWSLLLVDIDRLRDVNATHGHAVGDAIVARVAAVVAAVVASADGFAARVGGDAFALIVDAIEPREAEALATALVGDAANGMRADAPVAVDVSVGVVHCAPAERSMQPPLARAELALAEAKRRGGGRAVVFNTRFAAALETRNALDAQIAAALEHQQLTIFYQPQIALQSGAVVGLEALVRWQHPERGLLLPDAFMELAFDRGLIDAITKSVLTQVCGQIAAWRREGAVPELPVSVNVSGRQFHDRRLPALVASALLKSGLPARLLVLEITEQSLVGDDTEIDRVVKELSRLGVRIAIGDFNVGHASFRYLRQLKVSQVKLDRGFIRQLPDDPESVIVVGAVVDLARRLKYQVIAEGVETAAQFEHLRAIGCEAGQGYHFGKPLSAVDIRAYLAPVDGRAQPATP